jgi:bromodomain-containing factor 1
MSEKNEILYHEIDKEIKSKLMKILSTIKKLKEAYEFLEAVDYIKYNIPDYLDVIKYPRDLSIVQFNLENDYYRDIQSFLNDVQLIWDNCYTYNPPLNYISKCAQICEKKFKTEFEKYFNINIDENEEYSHENIGINEKMELKDTISKLIKNNNLKALNNLKNYCIKIVPHIIQINEDKKTYKIIFDKLNRHILEKIYEIINL